VEIVEYEPQRFEGVRRLGERVGAMSLCHRPFVDHYYAGSDHCRMQLAIGDDGSVCACLGVERMPFEVASRPVTLGFGTSFHSLRPGAGAYLYAQWMRRCDAGIAFGGSRAFHRMIARQGWEYFDGIHTYSSEAGTAPAGRTWWGAARGLARRVDLRESAARSARAAGGGLRVREEADYSDDMLPRRSPFTLRFAPTIDYLRWRYATGLSFVRYRLFRLLRAGETVGYVVVNDASRTLIVAQCDGSDATLLAHGVLLSLVEAASEQTDPRDVLVTSSHPAMQEVYARSGFTVRRRWDRPFALGPTRGRFVVPPSPAEWLVSYDWGDNGLRAPFRDGA
jgi:hypothetical protein